ncbi:MAG: carboxypeptidase regulatory-like domain-containing protein [bacterium]|nr:carboxypeptidase regulatory-like domain-containing protein [bacterium]
MVRFRQTIFGGLLVTLFLTACAHERAQVPGDKAGGSPRDLAGCVVDTDGNPVRGAEVCLYYAHGSDGFRDRVAGMTRSKRGGRFAFKSAITWEPLLPQRNRHADPPQYSIVAWHSDRGLGFAGVREGGNLDDVRIVLHDTRRHTVRVKDLNGDPVEGATVWLSSAAQPEAVRDGLPPESRHFYVHEPLGFCSGTTDARGRIRFMAADRSAFRVAKDGFVARYKSPGDYVLHPAARVTGTVSYADGSPAAGTVVWYEYMAESTSLEVAAVTDEAGRYALRAVAGAGYFTEGDQEKDDGVGWLRVEDPRPNSPYVAPYATFPIRSGDHVERDIVLTEGLILSGSVTDLAADGPAANVELECLHSIPRSRFLHSYLLRADDQGRFETRVAAGTHFWVDWEQPRGGGYRVDPQWLEHNERVFRGVIEQDMTGLAFYVKLCPIRPFAGRVAYPDGRPAEGVRVFVDSDIPDVRTDASGAFAFDQAPSEFNVFALTEDQTLMASCSIPLDTNDKELVLEEARDYEGQVATTNGVPAGDLTFNLYPAAPTSRVRRSVTTREDGSFTAEGLCPRLKYTARWSSDQDKNRDYGGGETRIDLTSLKPDETIRFSVKSHLNALMGKVLDQEGNPIAGAGFRVVSDASMRRTDRDRPIRSGEDGGFEIPLLAPGEVVIRISAEGFKTRCVTADSNDIEFETVLRPASRRTQLTVAIVDDDGNAVEGAPVVLRLPPEAHKESSRETYTDRTGVSGRCRFAFDVGDGQEDAIGLLGCDMDGYTVAYRGIRLCEDGDFVFTITKSCSHYAGQILDARGRPIQDAVVRVDTLAQQNASRSLMAEFDDDLAYTFTTDADGRFELTRFSDRDIIVAAATADGYASETVYWNPQNLSLTDHKVISLMPAGALRGCVTLKSTGEPLPDVQMQIIGPGRSEQEIASQPDGTFSVEGVRPGHHTFYFTDPSGAALRYVCADHIQCRVSAGRAAEIVIEMEEGIPIRGRFVLRGTGEAPGTSPWLSARDDRYRRYGADPKDDGSWCLYLPPGRFHLSYYYGGAERTHNTAPLAVERGKTYDEVVIELDDE